MIPGHFPGHKSTLANWITDTWKDCFSNSLFPTPWPWFQIKFQFSECASFHCVVVLGSSRESEGGREARLKWQGEVEVRIAAALAELCRTGCTAGHEQVVLWQSCGVTEWGQQVLPARTEIHQLHFLCSHCLNLFFFHYFFLSFFFILFFGRGL